MGTANRDIIMDLLKNEGAADLLDLLLGDNLYRVSGEPTFSTNEERDAYVMTIEHLRFLKKYGNQPGPIEDNGRIHFSYLDFFEKWLQLGTPGLAEDDLLNYLKHSKIDLKS